MHSSSKFFFHFVTNMSASGITCKLSVMRPLRIIILITGILVAGLALNTTFAQSIDQKNTDQKYKMAKLETKIHKDKHLKSHDHAIRADIKADTKHNKERLKAHKHEVKALDKSRKYETKQKSQKHEMKASLKKEHIKIKRNVQ
jgi:hypothetical protein